MGLSILGLTHFSCLFPHADFANLPINIFHKILHKNLIVTPQKLIQDSGQNPTYVPKYQPCAASHSQTVAACASKFFINIRYLLSYLNSSEGEDADDECEFLDDYTMTP